LGKLAKVSSAHSTFLKVISSDLASSSLWFSWAVCGLSFSSPAMLDHTVTSSSGQVYVRFSSSPFFFSSVGVPALLLT
jgi:hypothetical protein